MSSDASATLGAQRANNQSLPHLTHYFPWVSDPAIITKEDYHRIDDPLVFTRLVAVVALSAIITAGLAWACPPIALFIATYDKAFVFGSVALYALSIISEAWRAKKAIDTIVEGRCKDKEFKHLSRADINWLASRPNLVQHLIDGGSNFDTLLDGDGNTVAHYILQNPFISSPDYVAVFEKLIDSKVSLDQGNCNNEDLLTRAVQHDNPAYLECILTKTRAYFNSSRQIEIWKHVRSEKRLQLLCENGFKLDIQNDEGTTPLMAIASHPNINRFHGLIVAALNKGANASAVNNNNEKVSDLIDKEKWPLTYYLLKEKEAQGAESTENKKILLPGQWLSWLPWKPVITKTYSSYEPEHNTNPIFFLVTRVAQVAFIVLISESSFMNYLIIANPIAYTAIFFASVFLAFAPEIFQALREEKEANRLAVIDWLTSSIPSRQALYRISRNIDAVRLLIIAQNKPSVLNKMDENGNRLLTSSHDFKIRKKLIKNDADPIKETFAYGGNSFNSFLIAVQDSDSSFLEYMLSQKCIRIQKLPPELQVKMWLSIGSKKTAELLVKYEDIYADKGKEKFNPNICCEVQDKDGPQKRYTSLMLLANEKLNPSMKRCSYLPFSDHIEALFEAGANPLLIENGKKAGDLATNALVRCEFNSLENRQLKRNKRAEEGKEEKSQEPPPN